MCYWNLKDGYLVEFDGVLVYFLVVSLFWGWVCRVGRKSVYLLSWSNIRYMKVIIYWAKSLQEINRNHKTSKHWHLSAQLMIISLLVRNSYLPRNRSHRQQRHLFIRQRRESHQWNLSITLAPHLLCKVKASKNVSRAFVSKYNHFICPSI